MRNHPDCYGTIFPDFTRLKFKERLEGRAFTARITSSGIGTEGRDLEVKAEDWEKCLACPEYRTCYDLSMAKLLMNEVLVNTMMADRWVGDYGD